MSSWKSSLVLPVVDSSKHFNTDRYFSFLKRLSVFGAPQIHFERDPFSLVVENRHLPWALCIVVKLPKNVVAFLVGKTFSIGLKDPSKFSVTPHFISQFMQCLPSVFPFHSGKYLERINYLNLVEIF